MIQNPVSDLGKGFRDALSPDRVWWVWQDEYTYILAVIVLFVLLFSGLFDSVIFRYRHFVRARRKEDKKRAFLSRLIFERGEKNDAETELLRRLIRYYSLGSDSAGLHAQPDQLLAYTKSLFRLTRRLEYDKRGRLTIPALEQQLETQVRPEPAAREPTTGGSPEWKGVVFNRARGAPESFSKAQRVALSLIRLNKPSA